MLCPICEIETKHIYFINKFNPKLDIYECLNCKLQIQKIRKLNFSNLYNKKYYSGEANYSYYDERKYVKFNNYVWVSRLKNISKFISKPAKFLDIGCAFGGFVEAAKNFGYDSSGIDVSKYAVNIAKKNGLNVENTDLENIFKNKKIKKNHYDIITLIEVFEHLKNPIEAVKNLNKLLKSKGLVVLQTANFLGWQAKLAGSNYNYYLPGHLYYYNTKNLRLLFKKFGFSKIKFYRGVDISLLSKLKKSKGYFKNIKDYRNWIRIIFYHLISKIAYKDFAISSSMVMYAFKD